MSVLKTIDLNRVQPNPHRLIGSYPFSERKIATLIRSINDVGLWEGVIARERGDHIQLAFGHHRIEAAKRAGLQEATIIIRELNNEQMFQFMGRENLEDYNSDFLTLLETWEAATKYLGMIVPKSRKALDIARVLGWTRHSETGAAKDRLTATASACNSAYLLIQGGYLDRQSLAEMSVNAARLIVERAQGRMEQLEKIGREKRHNHAEIEAAKKQVGRAAKKTVKDYKEGKTKQKDLRGEVDINSYRLAKAAKKPSPLFSSFGKALANSIEAMLKTDKTAKKLEKVIEAIPHLQAVEDKDIVERLSFELNGLKKRAERLTARISKASAENKVVQLNVVKEKDEDVS